MTSSHDRTPDRIAAPACSPAEREAMLERCDEERAWQRMNTLAGPEMAGRYPGSQGEAIAAGFLERELLAAGFEPLRELGTFRDAFSFEVSEFTASPTLEAVGPGARRRFAHLEDYAVYVQGAAGAGRAQARTLWLGSLGTPVSSKATKGCIGVVDGAAAGSDVTSSFQVYLQQVRAARDLGLVGLLRVDPVVDVRKAMIHARETRSIPAFAIAPSVRSALFGTDRPASLAVGADVLMDAPLVYREVQSAGNVIAEVGHGPIGLVLSAHYDHLGALPDGRYFPGASDDASGVAVVLGAAEALAGVATSWPLRVVLVFTTGEETGLVGARRFVDRFGSALSSTTGVVCVDEVSGGGRTPLYLLKAPGWDEVLGVRDNDGVVGYPVRTGRLRLDGYADDVVFLQRGFRRVAVLLSRDADRVVTHTLRDTADLITPARLAAGMRALVLTCLRMSR